MKFLISLFLTLSAAYSQACDCGNTHAFNSTNFKCVQYPQNGQTKGFIEGCNKYKLTGFHGDQWNCLGCSPSYIFSDNKTCTDTKLEGCIKFKPVQNQNQAQNNTEQPDQQQESNVYQRFLAQETNTTQQGNNNTQQGSNNTQQEGNKYQCEACYKNEYYLKDHSCVKNPQSGDNYVQSCISYKYINNTVQCQKCSDGNYLDGEKKCYQNPSDLHCEVVSFNNDTQSLECNKCNKGYYRDNQYKCRQNPNEPKGCTDFWYISGNKTMCNGCEEGYVLGKENKCVKFNDAIKNCQLVEYSKGNKEYQCFDCKGGYYISQNRQQCSENPDKNDQSYINDCELYGYSSIYKRIVCGKCKGNMAVSKKQDSCDNLNLADSEKVQNCFSYKTYPNGDQTCSSCDVGFVETKKLGNIVSCKKCPKNPDSSSSSSSQVIQISLVLVIFILFSIL